MTNLLCSTLSVFQNSECCSKLRLLFIWKIIDINLAERILIRLKTGLYSYLQSIKDDDGWCKYYTENSEFEKTERDVHPDEDWKISLEVLL